MNSNVKGALDVKVQGTLDAYSASVDTYADSTVTVVSGGMQEWLNACVENLPASASILELGSGTGRDADYLESKGYSVQRSDAVTGFVNLMESAGHSVLTLEALHGVYPEEVDLIFANAVACHFDVEMMTVFLQKAASTLKPGGRLALTLKTAEDFGISWQNRLGVDRMFAFWPEKVLIELMNKFGFIPQFTNFTSVSRDPKHKSDWLNVVYKKIC